MKADYEHYKLHWEFFKSVNPKADERFFVELQINDTDKQIKQGLKEIDFANDSTNTIEGYTNNSKRMDFFFHKEYNEFLKAKLVELKAKENLKVLPQLKNSIIVHYGCSDFNSNEHKVYWIGAISHTPNKSYFFENRNEVEVIEKFYKYVQDNKEKTFIHWSMNSPKFGFRAIENRYFTLTNNKIDLQPKYEIDLSEYLKDKYGINYIERQNGRLNNLAKLNGFSGIQSDVEVININDATNRLELIFSIVQAEIQGNLKTENNNLTPQQNEKPKPELKLNDFFIKEVSSDTIAAIQTEFNELEGKDLAILIYLLHKEYKKIEILTNSRTKGRKGFVKCLKETDNPKMQKVNKCFVPNTDDLIYSKDDLVFQSLNKRLTETITETIKNIVV